MFGREEIDSWAHSEPIRFILTIDNSQICVIAIRVLKFISSWSLKKIATSYYRNRKCLYCRRCNGENSDKYFWNVEKRNTLPLLPLDVAKSWKKVSQFFQSERGGLLTIIDNNRVGNPCNSTFLTVSIRKTKWRRWWDMWDCAINCKKWLYDECCKQEEADQHYSL